MSIEKFATYVLSFYGEEGIYNMKATRDQVLIATGMLLAECNHSGMEFCGDSVDRERVRDIMIDEFKLVFPVKVA